MSSALFEIYPIVIAAFPWGKEWSATSIIIHCDNEATVHCINKSRSHLPMLTPLLRRLIWIPACDQFIITARHIPGSKKSYSWLSLSFFLSERWHRRQIYSPPQYLPFQNSRRSAICISPLPQQCLLPQERYLFFPTAAAVLAPAEAFSPPGTSPPPPPPPPSLPSTTHNGPFPPPFPTAPCHPGTPTSCFLHCRSSACSSRNLL